MRYLTLFLLSPSYLALALRLELTGRSLASLKSFTNNVLAATDDDHLDSVTSTRDVLYIANVTIEGTSYPLQMDTGSSDLWVDMGSNQPARVTTTSYNLTYGTGYAYGPIARGPVSFADYEIPDQAYLQFKDGANPVFHFGAVGIVGLGFTGLSHIDAAVDTGGATWGRSLLYNIFALNPTEPNFIAMALERDSDETNTVLGSLGVGELADEYVDVKDSPKIPLFPPEGSTRWTVMLDSFAVNGANQNITSAVTDVPTGRAVVLLDSGTTYSYAPPSVANAIYSGIPGAVLDTTANQWSVPCSAGVRLTLWIAGQPFDIHPLDVVVPSLSDATKCIGSFMPTQVSVGASEFDWIVGTNVLRSLYAVYDFGDFDDNNQMGNPYIQLLSVVDINQAASTFQASRGGAVNVNSGNGVASASVSVESTSDKLDKLVKIIPILFAIAGANALILITLLVLGIWMFCHFRKQKARKQKNPPLPLTTMASSNHNYEAVPTADNDGRPSSAHTRRSMSAMSRSISKHSLSGNGINELTSHPNASQSSLVRPSINVSRDDDAGSIRSMRVPVGSDSRRSSRLTPPGDMAPIKTRHSRVPSNLATASPTTPTTPRIATTPPQEDDELTDAKLMPHDENAEADITDKHASVSKPKRRTFEPPPPISTGYRKSMASDMSASPTVAGSEGGHMMGGRERTISTYKDGPPRQSSLNNEITPGSALSPSPTESSYQDARQSYYSNPNASVTGLPQSAGNGHHDSPNTGRMQPSSAAATPSVPVVMEETPGQQQQDSTASGLSRKETQRAAFMAALDEPLPAPRRPRVAGGGGYGGSHGTGGGGLSVGMQDQQARMSAYHALAPSQDQYDNSQYRHSYAAPPQGSPRVPAGFAGAGVGARQFQQEYAASGSPQRSSYASNSGSRRGPYTSNSSPFNPQQPPSSAPPYPPSGSS